MVLKENFSINDETATERFNHIIIIKFLSHRIENVSSSSFMYRFISLEKIILATLDPSYVISLIW